MTMKDRPQKAAALKYVVSRRWFPQVELDVSTFLTTRESSLSITDIDVFASVPDEFLGFRGFLIDCKTKKGESPVNRALWLNGLMQRMAVTHGMCILRTRGIESDHRYTAAKLGVHLLAEHEFDAYAAATSPRWSSNGGALANIELWDKFFQIPARFPSLGPAIRFSKSRYWMASDATEACRLTIALARQLRGELDPTKPEHVAVVGDMVALFTHALGGMVSKIFAGYLQPKEKAELSEALLILFCGGRDSYEQRNRIKKLFATLHKPEAQEEALLVPEMEGFVDLVRQALDAPLELLRAPLLIREVAWSALAGVPPGTMAREIAGEFKHAARLSVLASDYLRKAVQYPAEFSQTLADSILKAQLKPVK
jgi:hypothetical protein